MDLLTPRNVAYAKDSDFVEGTDRCKWPSQIKIISMIRSALVQVMSMKAEEMEKFVTAMNLLAPMDACYTKKTDFLDGLEKCKWPKGVKLKSMMRLALSTSIPPTVLLDGEATYGAGQSEGSKDPSGIGHFSQAEVPGAGGSSMGVTPAHILTCFYCIRPVCRQAHHCEGCGVTRCMWCLNRGAPCECEGEGDACRLHQDICCTDEGTEEQGGKIEEHEEGVVLSLSAILDKGGKRKKCLFCLDNEVNNKYIFCHPCGRDFNKLRRDANRHGVAIKTKFDTVVEQRGLKLQSMMSKYQAGGAGNRQTKNLEGVVPQEQWFTHGLGMNPP